MEDIIKKILEIAVRAPSGENSQPWKFIVQDNKIDIFNIPERDTSLYNFQQLGSFVAHGALIENIIIITSSFGYTAEVNIFPDRNDVNYTATIILEKSMLKKDFLLDFITKRHTNRNPYKNKSLSLEQKTELINSGREIQNGEIRIVDDAKKKSLLAKAFSVSDRLLFENKKIHDFLFEHISWTEKEAVERKSGFYIKELGLSVAQEKMFKLFRNWNILSYFNKIGFSKIVAKENARLYSTSSAFLTVLMPSNTLTDFILGGRLAQRMWLTATKMDLSIQPLTGITFFMQRVLSNETKDFSSKQIELIKNAYNLITDIFSIKDKTIVMIFRVGYSDASTFYSLRLPSKILHRQT